MKITKGTLCSGLVLGCLSCVSRLGAQTVAYQNPTSLPVSGLQGSGTGGPFNLGLEFTVNTPVQVTALGAFDSTVGRSGVGFGSSVEVAIFSEATSTFISPIVTFSGINGTIIDGSQFQSISVLTLEPGTYKIVASGYALDTAEDWNVYFSGDTTSPILFNDGGGALTLGLNYNGEATDGLADPDNVDALPSPAYAAGTFSYTVVPEPSSTGLFFLGSTILATSFMVQRFARLKSRQY